MSAIQSGLTIFVNKTAFSKGAANFSPRKMTENEKFAFFEVYFLGLGNFCPVVKVVFKYFGLNLKLEIQTWNIVF